MNEVLRALGLPADDRQALDLLHRTDQAQPGTPVPRDWRHLAAALVRRLAADGPPGGPVVLAISGGQGSGKSTLARRIEATLRAAGLRAAACSLDDFYLTRAERADLGARVHPLLATRGVPGTHDTSLLGQVLDGLGATGTLDLPVFDKGTDDRLTADQWRQVVTPLDVLVLEGWCLGAGPEPEAALTRPVNDLEALHDPDCRWRRYVNTALAGPYRELWTRFHQLIYLAVPDMAAVVRWRTQQEQGLPAARRMSAADVERFVEHYERTTRQQARTLPARADVVVTLGPDHAMAALRCNGAGT